MMTLTDDLKAALLAAGDQSHEAGRHQVASEMVEGVRRQYGHRGVEFLVSAFNLLSSVAVVDRRAEGLR